MLDGPTVVARMRRMLPAQEQVTLHTRQAGETSPVDSTWWARRRGLEAEELVVVNAAIGEIWITLELMKETQSVNPVPGDSITDAQGVTWQVKRAPGKVGGYVFNCYCLKNL